MSASSILILLLAALMHALWNYLAKASRNPTAFMWCLVASSAGMLLPVSLWLSSRQPLPMQGIVFALASGIVQAAYFTSLARAYRDGDLSVVYPLSRSISLMLLPAVAFVLLKERLSGMGFAGIGCVLLGIYVLQMRELSITSLLRPVLSLGERPQLWAIGTGISTALYSTVDKAGMLSGIHPVIYYNVCIIVVMIALAPMAFAQRSALRDEWRRSRWPLLMSGLLMPASYALALYVMKTDAASYVLAVRQVSVVLGVVIGNRVLREPYGGIRLAGGSIIFLGIVLIGLAR